MTPKPRIRIDKRRVPQGDVVEVRTLVSHLMETGERQVDGVLVPRSILKKFSCEAGGGEIFSADLTAAVSANPYMRFKFKPQGPGPLSLRFTWIDEDGNSIVAEEQIIVT
jgi:sulfur-oxidizing protein SoxZ